MLQFKYPSPEFIQELKTITETQLSCDFKCDPHVDRLALINEISYADFYQSTESTRRILFNSPVDFDLPWNNWEEIVNRHRLIDRDYFVNNLGSDREPYQTHVMVNDISDPRFFVNVRFPGYDDVTIRFHMSFYHSPAIMTSDSDPRNRREEGFALSLGICGHDLNYSPNHGIYKSYVALKYYSRNFFSGENDLIAACKETPLFMNYKIVNGERVYFPNLSTDYVTAALPPLSDIVYDSIRKMMTEGDFINYVIKCNYNNAKANKKFKRTNTKSPSSGS